MIKTYENFNKSYKIGDYVLIQNAYMKDTPYGKIIAKDEESVVPYQTLLINNSHFWIMSDMIVRKLNQTEIDFFELKTASDKYNL
jgi:hypothetical protein